ncbi:MAG: DUF4919 domain-containing protein [Saprospiraceae bacterium]|nr:DUF4919 domain-containing protein [Saprospiraceae bacterium]
MQNKKSIFAVQLEKFMKQIVIVALWLVGATLGFSQPVQPVNYADVESEISNPASKNYFPKLLEVYNTSPELLTPEQYRLLYYGFTFQEAYRPYDKNEQEAELASLMASNMDTMEDYEALAQKAKAILADDPFNLKMLYYLKNFNITLLRFEENIQIDRRFDGLIGAILSSGDGKSEESAFAINTISDEYMVIRAFGLKSTGQEYVGKTDYISLAENDFGIAGYYFDNARLMHVGTAQIGVETLDIQDEEIPEDAIEIGSKEEVNRFVPLGFEILAQEKGDVDGDGDSDWALVLRKEGEELLSNAAADDPEPRILMVLTRANDGLLDVAFRNEAAIPCIDCGGETDPFRSLTIGDGVLSIATLEAGLLITERVMEFAYNAEANRWLMQKDMLSSYKKGKEDKKQTLTETTEDFGEVALRDFQY